LKLSFVEVKQIELLCEDPQDDPRKLAVLSLARILSGFAFVLSSCSAN